MCSDCDRPATYPDGRCDACYEAACRRACHDAWDRERLASARYHAGRERTRPRDQNYYPRPKQ